jgi:hypothetical protein
MICRAQPPKREPRVGLAASAMPTRALYRPALLLADELRRDRTMAWRLVVKHLAQIACIHPLATYAAAIRQFTLLRERRVELLRDPAGKGVVELESVSIGFADHEH